MHQCISGILLLVKLQLWFCLVFYSSGFQPGGHKIINVSKKKKLYPIFEFSLSFLDHCTYLNKTATWNVTMAPAYTQFFLQGVTNPKGWESRINK